MDSDLNDMVSPSQSSPSLSTSGNQTKNSTSETNPTVVSEIINYFNFKAFTRIEIQ